MHRYLKRVIVVILSQAVSPAIADTYVVSPQGDDSYPGTTDSAFATIQHAAGVARAGDIVTVKEGVYYERKVTLANSGSADSPITFKAADGETVVIDHGLRVDSWTLDNGSVYHGMPVFPGVNDLPGNTLRVIVAGEPLVGADSRDAMVEGSFWVDGSGRVYAWGFGGAVPQDTNTCIINASDNHKPGFFTSAEHIVLEGFTIRAAETAIWAGTFACWGSSGPTVGQPEGLTIRNCEIAYNWQYALRLDSYRNVVMENCNVHHCGMVNLPRGSTGWPHAIIGWDGHDVTIRGCSVHDTHGEGVGPYLWCSNWLIENNEVYDNWSVNIYVDTDMGDMTVRGNLVYNTGKYSGDSRDNPDGIRIANEQADLNGGDPTPEVERVYVYNNICINTGGGICAFKYSPGMSFLLKNSVIANNTIVDIPSGSQGLWVEGDSVSVTNNLLLRCASPTSFVPSGTGIIEESNLVTDDAGLTVGTGYAAANYLPTATSSVVDAGVALSLVSDDFAGVTRPQGDAYDIGALEYEPTTVSGFRIRQHVPGVYPSSSVLYRVDGRCVRRSRFPMQGTGWAVLPATDSETGARYRLVVIH